MHGTSRTKTRHRVAVVGTGAMGRVHVRVLAEMPTRFELVGVYDPDLSVAEPLARTWGVAAFVREADAVARADLVVVASPIGAHAASVRRALEAGKSVLVEKPLCARAEEGALLARAARPGRYVFVGH